MSVSQDFPQEAAAPPRRTADWLRAGEWLFLLFVLTIASYALSLQPQLQTLCWYVAYLGALGLFMLRYGAFLGGLWVAVPLLLWPLIAGLSSGSAPSSSAGSGLEASRCTRSTISMSIRGGSSKGSPMYHSRYAVWAHVGQASVMSACTRGGRPSPGSP